MLLQNLWSILIAYIKNKEKNDKAPLLVSRGIDIMVQHIPDIPFFINANMTSTTSLTYTGQRYSS